jgi:hypothetical protein
MKVDTRALVILALGMVLVWGIPGAIGGMLPSESVTAAEVVVGLSPEEALGAIGPERWSPEVLPRVVGNPGKLRLEGRLASVPLVERPDGDRQVRVFDVDASEADFGGTLRIGAVARGAETVVVVERRSVAVNWWTRALWGALGPPLPAPELILGGLRGEGAEVISGERASRVLTAARAQGRLAGGARKLQGTLMAGLPGAGAGERFEAYSDRAGELEAAMSKSFGGPLGRTSLRLRNPENEAPGWVRDWMMTHELGSGPRSSGGWWTEGPGSLVRVIVPLTTEPSCGECHGPVEALDPSVEASRLTRYPKDEAVNHRPGDLLGVVWAEASVPEGP